MRVGGVRVRGELVRGYIFANVAKHPSDIARVTAARFGITRQAVNKHLQKLVTDGLLAHSGDTRSRRYTLAPLSVWERSYDIQPGLDEDAVWTRDVSVALGELPENVRGIWHHGFTEIFNNAIDHSGGRSIEVDVRKTAESAEVTISDDGIGIFRKIQSELGLLDERHAILELSKGKVTTDPGRHTGEGIFFTSRMLDSFVILSGGAFFSHENEHAKDLLLESGHSAQGTAVLMRLSHRATRTAKEVFDAYVSGEDYDFSKTVVPVRLALHGNDKLISRSQAKRVLSRVDRFRTVVLDFHEVDTIGQAFADEIFRVFVAGHPEIELVALRANADVKRMIGRAKATG